MKSPKLHVNTGVGFADSSNDHPSHSPSTADSTKINAGMDVDNIIATPAHDSKSSKASDIGDGSPKPKRQRMTRADRLGRKPVDYDMKHHPMDDVLRPKAAAKRRAHDQSVRQPSDNDEDDGSPDEESDLSAPKAIRKPMAGPQTPERLRVTRAGTLGEKAVDYDMKHHPMDDVLRPKAAAKRSVWFKSLSPPSLSQEAADASKPSPMANNDPENPFVKSIHDDWKKLQAFDRRVYLLQKGSPIHGNTLPLKWSKVVEVLIEDGFFTREQFKSWGGFEVLKSRYESTRLRIEGFFGAIPEPTNKMGWQVVHAEGFEVYGMGVGEKYWPHYCDSIVCPPSIKRKEAFTKPGDDEDGKGEDEYPEVAGSSQIHKITQDDEISVRGSKNATVDPNDDRVVLEASPTLSHDAQSALQAEDELMESLRSALSSEVGPPMMDDDELDAVLGDMGMANPSSATDTAAHESATLSSSLSDPDTSLLEPRKKSQQESNRVDVAITSRIPCTPRKAELPNLEVELTGHTTFGNVPPSVIKAAQRSEQQKIQNSCKKSPGGKSTVSGTKFAAASESFDTTEVLFQPKAPKKVYKRGSRVKSSSVDFEVHEDQPGNTPLVKKQITQHPKSPGTDIKKENFDHHDQAASDNTAHDRLQQAIANSHTTTRNSEGRLTRLNSTRFRPASAGTMQSSPDFVVADGRAAGNVRMGPNAFVTPLTPRSTRIRRV